MKRLSNYAKEQGISYMQAYRLFRAGEIPGAFKSETGQILVNSASQSVGSLVQNEDFDSMVSIYEAQASVRTNRSAHIRQNEKFTHLENSPIPFTYTAGGGYKESDVSVRDAIILCQRAYYGFSIFRATIELFTEFCVNNIYFKGGTKRSRSFFDLFFRKVGLNRLQDMFYRELWRSGNCFIYRYFGKLEGEEYKEMVRLFGGNINRSSVEIPIKYVLLNPADIQAQGSITFDKPTYLQVLSDYELERLRNPRTSQDKAVLESLSPEDREKIKGRGVGAVYRELSTKDIIAIFLSKQSYEALSVPLGFGVLEHLNHKKELELMDQAIARTVQQAILLVKTGAPPDKGGINYKNIENLRKIFESETVSRTLVADYTTEVEFVIPQIGDILDPKKYEEINQNIAIGLGNVFLIQGEKFANQSAKIDLFLQKLQGARRLFLEEFLIPEMKYIAGELGLKGEIPQPFYEQLDLKNEIEYSKIYVRMMELGLLTVEEGITAIETGKLPTKEDSLESQREYKQARDQELYKPLLGKDPKEEEGRAPGSKVPTQKKTVSPVGGNISLNKVKDNMVKAQKLEEKVKEIIKQNHKIQNLTESQLSVINEIAAVIMKNEPIENWEVCAETYINNPDFTTDLSKEIEEVCRDYGVDSYLGAILYNSKIN